MNVSDPHNQKLMDYLVSSMKREVFDDYLSVHPTSCARLLKYLVNIELTRLDDDK